ncbi:hypothetical protein HWV62_26969, partial [Athelia sp. TMB]
MPTLVFAPPSQFDTARFTPGYHRPTMGHDRDMYTLMVQEDEELVQRRASPHDDDDEDDTDATLPRLRMYAAILPSPRRALTRRPLLAAALLLALVSLCSTALLYARGSAPLFESDLGDAPEAAPAPTPTPIPQLAPIPIPENWPSAPGSAWRPFPASAPALALEPHERPTLSQTYFAPRGCLDAWVAHSILCPALLSPSYPTAFAEALKLRVVHTWVNGSSPALARVKEAMYAATHEATTGKKVYTRPGDARRHFTDHGELVHSLRSVVASLSPAHLAGFTLITTDLPVSAFAESPAELEGVGEWAGEGEGVRMGQVPVWLDLEGQRCEAGTGVGVSMRHHWDLFKMRAATSSTPKRTVDSSDEILDAADEVAEIWGGREDEREREAERWRADALPSFNSIGIETQLVGIAETNAPQETFLYFNDDFFLTRTLAPTDFASPLFGPVLRMQRDPTVASTPRGASTADPDGEWPSLGYANWLLDARFSSPAPATTEGALFAKGGKGGRKRGYIQHFAKSFSAPLLAELGGMWGRALTDGGAVRFRGDGKGAAPGVAFLAANFVVERHREALLFAYLVLRSSTPGSAAYTGEEKARVLRDMGYEGRERVLLVREPVRAALSAEGVLVEAGLGGPQATHYSFTAAHSGYAYAWFAGRPVLRPPGAAGLRMGAGKKVGSAGAEYVAGRPAGSWPSYTDTKEGELACVLDIEECFGPGFLGPGPVSVEETMKRVAFERPQCGDCVISRLLALSGPRGLSAFLPPARPAADAQWEAALARGEVRVALDSAPRWADARFPNEGGRARALQLLQRYAYSLGDSPAEFVKVASVRGLARSLKSLRGRMAGADAPAFLVMNDDVNDRASVGEVEGVTRMLGGWMEEMWPQKTPSPCHYIAMDRTPPEIWARISSHACTDAGATGRSLSRVSKGIRDASAPFKLQSISICGKQQAAAFQDILLRTPPQLRRVRYLYLSTHKAASDKFNMAGKLRQLGRRTMWDQLVKDKRGQAEQQQQTCIVLNRILQMTAEWVEILYLDDDDLFRVGDSPLVNFPRLEELACGSFPIHDLPGDSDAVKNPV